MSEFTDRMQRLYGIRPELGAKMEQLPPEELAGILKRPDTTYTGAQLADRDEAEREMADQWASDFVARKADAPPADLPLAARQSLDEALARVGRPEPFQAPPRKYDGNGAAARYDNSVTPGGTPMPSTGEAPSRTLLWNWNRAMNGQPASDASANQLLDALIYYAPPTGGPSRGAFIRRNEGLQPLRRALLGY